MNQEKEGAGRHRKTVGSLFQLYFPAAQALGASLNLGAANSLTRVLDVAAGSGVWGIALARASPYVRATSVDWGEVISLTEEMAHRHGVAERVVPLAGDLREIDLGNEFDIAVLGHILHSEGPKQSEKLIDKVFQALRPGGTIAIAEYVVNPERTSPLSALIMAVSMLVNTEEGDTFSFEEIGAWLHKAGFTRIRTIPVLGASEVILADRPE